MSGDELEGLAARHLAAMNRHDAPAVARLYSEQGRWSEPPGSHDLEGRRAMTQYLLLLFRAFPDLTISALRTLTCRDACVVEWRAEATHRGAFLGVRGTGRRVDVHGASILDVREGLVLASHHYCDSATVLRQLDQLARGESL